MDNDGYIDVANHAQLNAIRYDLDGNGDPTSAGATAYSAAFPNRVTTASGRMGCPTNGGCTGYELTASIDLDTDGDGNIGTDSGDAYYNSGAGWLPIGTDTSSTTRFQANFKGNGYTINNLFINRSSNFDQGLFGSTAGRIETLGVTNANITGSQFVGILAGINRGGTIVACYTTGSVTTTARGGGLVGILSGGTIASSYSTAYVSGASLTGGLVGYRYNGSVTNSYSTGRVARSSGTATSIGGLIGDSRAAASGTVTNSYWDTSTSGTTTSAGGSGVVGKTTRQLQTVTDYTAGSIYANWNTDLDNADNDNDATTGKDDPWTFGNKTQYPMLDYKMMSTDPQGGQAMGVSHNWNHPIVGEPVRVSLTAAAFANRATQTVSGQTKKKPWIWERSDNGDAWETISGSRSPTYEYAPTTTDVNHYLRAKVELTGGSFAYTRNLGGRVKNASDSNDATQGAAISFVSGHTSPRVGTPIVAGNPMPTGAVDARFRWQRCPNATSPHTDCVYIPDDSWCEIYTPVAADVGNYLRMYMYYATSAGVWTRHETGFTGQVAAAASQ